MSIDGGIYRHASDVCRAVGRVRKLTRYPQTSAEAVSRLERVVDVDIGPRLVLFHHERQPVLPPAVGPNRDDIQRLAILVIGTDEAETVAHFERVRAQGHSYTTLLAHFLAPAAHLLGELWRQDVCDFFEVTIGVGRLQAFMDRLTAPEPISAAEVQRRALMIALPGETHLLGVRMVAKFLEVTGWDVSVEEQLPAEDNARTVASEWIGVVGLSLSLASRAELAARTVSAIRGASMNPHIAIMAGGSAINENPELALQIGADAVGFDAPTAAIVASHLHTRQAAMR